MMQPKQASPKRRLKFRIRIAGKPIASMCAGHQDEDPQRGNEDASSRQDVHQDVWVTNFIGRLAGLVRNIGGRK
jgi:hypothetical protein